MGTLSYLSEYFSLLLPIMGFMVLLACLLFIMYLKRKTDVYFNYIVTLAKNTFRIAEALEKQNVRNE